MTFRLREGLRLLLAATLFSAPAMGQEADDGDDESEVILDGVSDVAQDLVQEGVERSLENHPERALPPPPPPRVMVKPGTAGSGLQGTAGLGDDALHTVPVGSFADDVAHAVPVGSFADDAVRAGSGMASVADDAARVAGGGCIKAIGGVFAALGALLAKLFGGGKKEE
ncbi:hypothetical protein [Hyalangium minutum]|uniref:Uncharacterized protein n=1 Tax=Hyalangium minutum TaxID=394096 RepID=A0A085WI18_9BACT|nr:hypothetical protein [Hyalangium minutum]KFE67331.1 hypothetical protein DB31_8684 [Hyalangium minutum]KFE67418.1 hypothetical protein DB31_8771 [Hyalangium minutum]